MKYLLAILLISMSGCGNEVEFARDDKKVTNMTTVCQQVPAKGLFTIYVQDGKFLDMDQLP